MLQAFWRYNGAHHLTQDSNKHLITADSAFPAMEKLVMSARNRLYISLHIFSARTRTRSAEAHQAGLVDWGDLVADALKRGVRIRFLLNDFDPVGAADMHASVWERVGLLDDKLAKLDNAARRRLTLMVAMPGGQTGALIRLGAWPFVRKLICDCMEQYGDGGRAVPPGLAKFKDGKVPFWPPTRNYTQALHQKFIVCDNRRAIVGGLDIDERRFDDAAHRRAGHQTWHDVSMETDENEARALVVHFARSWRLVRKYGKSFCDCYVEQRPSTALSFIKPEEGRPAKSGDKITRPIIPVPATIGVTRRSFVSFGPQRRVSTMEMAYFDMIGKAKKYIYIETQYIRSTALRDALIAQLAKEPDLHVIALLPAAPDAVAYLGNFGTVQRYGEWLQMDVLTRLRRLFPKRFGVFCLTNERDRDEKHERDALHGKAMVYIHSKISIADDRHAIVASANLNGRSMEWDFEPWSAIRQKTPPRPLPIGTRFPKAGGATVRKQRNTVSFHFHMSACDVFRNIAHSSPNKWFDGTFSNRAR
jgi:phosphatidylserine/phosphatidylglycerophosphate/cardiolipin synthase-like enzyme